jgi:hypothetical protein
MENQIGLHSTIPCQIPSTSENPHLASGFGIQVIFSSTNRNLANLRCQVCRQCQNINGYTYDPNPPTISQFSLPLTVSPHQTNTGTRRSRLIWYCTTLRSWDSAQSTVLGLRPACSLLFQRCGFRHGDNPRLSQDHLNRQLRRSRFSLLPLIVERMQLAISLERHLTRLSGDLGQIISKEL